MKPSGKSRNFLLVHGACHGAWCWGRVAPLLERKGHRVLAIDLPGRGPGDRAGWRHSLSSYADAVMAGARRMDGPVVAVGHSMGGQIISAAAEAAPDLFQRLVYLSAFLPVTGDSIASLSPHNTGSALATATHLSLWRGQLTILPATAAPVFYGDCEQADVAHAVSRLTVESLRPSLARIQLTMHRFGQVPRAYIRLTDDQAIMPAFQDFMLNRQPCERVLTLPTSHSPFLSKPLDLADAIEAAA